MNNMFLQPIKLEKNPRWYSQEIPKLPREKYFCKVQWSIKSTINLQLKETKYTRIFL